MGDVEWAGCPLTAIGLPRGCVPVIGETIRYQIVRRPSAIRHPLADAPMTQKDNPVTLTL